MEQFYFLSIVANLVCGTLLAAHLLERRASLPPGFYRYLSERPRVKLSLALFTFLIGFCKFIFVTWGDVPVVGDLLPALAGLVLGFTLWLDYYLERTASSEHPPFLDLCERSLLKHRELVGLSGIIVAALHFVMPSVIFL